MTNFPADPVALPDCQLNWEFLKTIFKTFVSVVSGKTNVSLNFGSGGGTWPGGTPRANNDNIAHGLNKTPTVVLATVISSPAAAWFPVLATVNYGATNFQITAVTSDGSSPAAATTYGIVWLAIG